jgi:chromosome partitioning protein
MSSAHVPLRPVRVIVVANEKGGSGKSTVAMHVAVALLKRGQRVATIDLDSRQKTFTHYIENRRTWAERAARGLKSPEHLCLDTQDEVTSAEVLSNALDMLGQSHDFVVIDTPGYDSPMMRLAHSMADILVTPLNDSFVDLDVLGSLDPDAMTVSAISHYAETVEQAQRQRRSSGLEAADWIVLRNRLSMTPTRNKRLVGAGLDELSRPARLPLRRRIGRAGGVPRVLPSRSDRVRRPGRSHARQAADDVAHDGAPGGGSPTGRHELGPRDGERSARRPETRRGLRSSTIPTKAAGESRPPF